VQRELKSRGGTVLAVTTDAPELSKKVADRYKITFDILSDPEAKVIAAYGLKSHDPFHDSVVALPANFLIEPGGRIVWRYLSSRVQDRADPADVLAQIKALPRRG
jgi:peroxiredoxin